MFTVVCKSFRFGFFTAFKIERAGCRLTVQHPSDFRHTRDARDEKPARDMRYAWRYGRSQARWIDVSLVRERGVLYGRFICSDVERPCERPWRRNTRTLSKGLTVRPRRVCAARLPARPVHHERCNLMQPSGNREQRSSTKPGTRGGIYGLRARMLPRTLPSCGLAVKGQPCSEVGGNRANNGGQKESD